MKTFGAAVRWALLVLVLCAIYSGWRVRQKTAAPARTFVGGPVLMSNVRPAGPPGRSAPAPLPAVSSNAPPGRLFAGQHPLLARSSAPEPRVSAAALRPPRFTNSPPSPGHVLLDGHKAHPTRLLVKPWRAGAASKEAPALANTGLEPTHRYSARSAWVLLDAADRASRAPVKPEEAPAKGQELQAKIQALRQSGLFERVEPDYVLTTQAEPDDSAFADGTLWGLRNTGQKGGTAGADVGAVPAWDITTGSTNVIVAVIDTGLSQTHHDLVTQLWRNPGETPGNGADEDGDGYIDDVFGINALWPPNDPRAGNPLDDHGHGTHVAGTIGAAANNGYPHVGVAWQVRLLAAKFLNEQGEGYDSDAIKCIEYAVAKGARILSCSWGGTGFSQALYDAFAAAGEQGVLVVAAAGNDLLDLDAANLEALRTYPAAFDLNNLISVAALDRRDRLAWFSNYGRQSVDLGAPGVDIFSCDAFDDSYYVSWQGTSMATPHVSGVAALVLARYPAISIPELRQRLIATAVPIPSLAGRAVSGGRVNAFNALTAAEDGTMEVAAQFFESFLVPAGTNTMPAIVAGRTNNFQLVVADLMPVTNAIVHARVLGGAELALRNDGLGPDLAAADHVYTAAFVVPDSTEPLAIAWGVAAPGKQTASNVLTALVVRPPPNDRFDDRTLLAGTNVAVRGSNIGAQLEPGEPPLRGASGHSVWWGWTAPMDGTVWLQITNDTLHAIYLPVYTGLTVSSLNPQPMSPIPGVFGLSFAAKAGTLYAICLDGYGGDYGDFTLWLHYHYETPAPDVPGLPLVTAPPRDLTLETGSDAYFGVGFKSLVPASCQWLVNGAPLTWPLATQLWVYDLTFTNAGLYAAVLSNSFGMVTSAPARLTVVAPEPDTNLFDDFEPGIDTRQWKSIGAGLAVNRSAGAVSGSNSLFFQTPSYTPSDTMTTRVLNTMNGGVVRFWLVCAFPSPEPDFHVSLRGSLSFSPFAAFYQTNYTHWKQVEVNIPPEAQGPAVRFAWRPDAGHFDPEELVGWALDDVEITLNLQAEPPVILQEQADLAADTGDPVSLAPELSGAAPWNFQWFRDGTALPGRTNRILSWLRATNTDSGLYELQAANALGWVRTRAARLIVRPEPTLAGAFDTTNLLTARAFPNRWRGVTTISHDGVDAVQSPLLKHNDYAWLEARVRGPGTVAFWWKSWFDPRDTSAVFDFYVDDEPVVPDFRGPQWTQVHIQIEDGEHSLVWFLDEDGTPFFGARLWLDQLEFTPGSPAPPQILAVTLDLTNAPFVLEGQDATLTVQTRGLGSDPGHQWRFNGVDLLGANQSVLRLPALTSAQSGLYSVWVSNSSGTAVSAPFQLIVLTPQQYSDHLAAALDTSGLTWSSADQYLNDDEILGAGWFSQTNVTHDGRSAGQTGGFAGDIGSGERTWVETVLDGPGELSFWWKTASDICDSLILYTNGQAHVWLNGETDWREQHVSIGAGRQTLRWSYERDDTSTEGAQNLAWLDQVAFRPGEIPSWPLGEALNNTNLAWRTGGPSGWYGQTNVTHDGQQAVVCGGLNKWQTNWLETTLQGPVTLSFWWKLESVHVNSPPPNFPSYPLYFFVDDELRLARQGELDWQPVSVAIPPGAHTARWVFSPIERCRANRVWLDDVTVAGITPHFAPGALTLLPDGRAQLRLDGPVGRPTVVEFSINLIDWQPVSTNFLDAAGTRTLILPAQQGAPAVFYRARLAQ